MWERVLRLRAEWLVPGLSGPFLCVRQERPSSGPAAHLRRTEGSRRRFENFCSTRFPVCGVGGALRAVRLGAGAVSGQEARLLAAVGAAREAAARAGGGDASLIGEARPRGRLPRPRCLPQTPRRRGGGIRRRSLRARPVGRLGAEEGATREGCREKGAVPTRSACEGAPGLRRREGSGPSLRALSVLASLAQEKPG